MTRALVLGGAGFVGSAACKELMRRGVETIAAGRKERPYGVFTSYVAFDRTDEAQLKRALDQVQPDVLLDLACYQPVEVESVIRNFKGDRYVFVSAGEPMGRARSSAIFGPTLVRWLTEGSPRPRS